MTRIFAPMWGRLAFGVPLMGVGIFETLMTALRFGLNPWADMAWLLISLFLLRTGVRGLSTRVDITDRVIDLHYLFKTRTVPLSRVRGVGLGTARGWPAVVLELDGGALRRLPLLMQGRLEQVEALKGEVTEAIVQGSPHPFE